MKCKLGGWAFTNDLEAVQGTGEYLLGSDDRFKPCIYHLLVVGHWDAI